MDGSCLRRDGDVKWGAFLQSLNTCFIRISPEELHNLIVFGHGTLGPVGTK